MSLYFSGKIIQRSNYSLIIVLAAPVLLNLLFTPYSNPVFCDTETYRYVSLVMMKGGVPYRDVFDHKPPLIYFVSYTGLFLGGWLQWLVDTLLAMLATFLFYRLCRKYRLPYPWLLPLLFNLMLRDFIIFVTAGLTREYTTILLLIFFCVLMSEHRRRYYGLGILSGLIFFFQQEQVLALIPFFIYDLTRRREKDVPAGRRIMAIAAGGLTVAAPIILYFAFHHALAAFWRDAFGFNFGVYTTSIRESFGDHLKRAKRILDYGNYEVPFLVAVTLGISALLFRGSNKRLIGACLAAVALSITPEFMGGRGTMGDIRHYYLPLSASLCMLLFSVFAFTEEPFLQAKKVHAIFGVLVCTSLGYIALQHGTHLAPRSQREVPASPALRYLRQHPPGDYQLYEFGDHAYIYAYNEFRILAPSRWVFHHLWTVYDNWDMDHAILRSIGQDLLRHRTSYIIDCIDDPAKHFHDPEAYVIWHSFLVEHYQQVALTDTSGVTLWKWKGLP